MIKQLVLFLYIHYYIHTYRYILRHRLILSLIFYDFHTLFLNRKVNSKFGCVVSFLGQGSSGTDSTIAFDAPMLNTFFIIQRCVITAATGCIQCLHTFQVQRMSHTCRVRYQMIKCDRMNLSDQFTSVDVSALPNLVLPVSQLYFLCNSEFYIN